MCTKGSFLKGGLKSIQAGHDVSLMKHQLLMTRRILKDESVSLVVDTAQVHIWMLLLATCFSCSSLVHSSTSSADGGGARRETHSELTDFTKIGFFSCSALKAKAQQRSYACLYVHVFISKGFNNTQSDHAVPVQLIHFLTSRWLPLPTDSKHRNC